MTLLAVAHPSRTAPLSTHDLARIVRRVAGEPQIWRPPLLARSGRTSVPLPASPGVDAWLVVWPGHQAGQDPGAGAAPAAFAVVHGTLTETRWDDVLGVWATTLKAPAVRVVEAGVIHRLHNEQTRPAVTIHAQAHR